MRVSEEDFKRMQRVRHPLGVEATTGGRSGGDGTGHRPSGADSRLQKPPASPYKSKWEAAYASKLALEKRAKVITNYWYEPFSLWLPGKIRYKPDFLVQRAGPVCFTALELLEVKGWSKNRRDGMTRLKMAAALFPCFHWTIARWTGRAFEVEVVVV